MKSSVESSLIEVRKVLSQKWYRPSTCEALDVSTPKDTTTQWTTTLPPCQHSSKEDYKNLQSFKCLTIEMEKYQKKRDEYAMEA